MIIIANFLICRVIYVCTRTMRNVMTSSRVDPRHLKKKFLSLFHLISKIWEKKRKKRMKIRNNFFRCPDIHIHIRIAILPSYNLRYCIARMRFLFISLDVKASF